MSQRRFRIGRRGVSVNLPDPERELLRELIPQMREAMSTTSGSAPVAEPLVRLFPTAYPDDTELNDEYRELMHDQLLAYKLEALDALERAAGSDSLDETDLHPCMTAINDMRLVLGTRLDVSEEGMELDPDHPDAVALAVYEYLGHLLDELVNEMGRRL